jgi:hypothetical protein
MRRREFMVILGAQWVAWPNNAHAQSKDVRRIAVWIAATEQGRSNLPTIKRRLEELGWAESRNLRIVVRGWTGDAATMRSQAEELLASQPEVMVVISNPALAILKPMAGMSQSSSRWLPIQLVAGSSLIWPILAATLQASPTSSLPWAANGSRC